MGRLILVIIVLFVLSCCKDDVVINVNKEVVYAPPLWEYPLHKNGSNSNSIIRANLVFDNGIMIGTTEGPGDRWLTMIDMDGNFLWKWNDIYQAPTEYMDVRHFYTDQSIFTYQVGSRSYYIDLTDGRTYRKIRRDVSFDSELSGFGDTYFLRGRPTDTLTEYNVTVGYRGSVATGEIEQFLVPFYDQDFIPNTKRVGDVAVMIPIEDGGQKLLIVIYQQQVSNISEFQSYLGLYDYDGEAWVYDRIILNEPAQNGVLLFDADIYDGKIYMNIGFDIVCFNFWTGDFIWRQSFTQDFLFSGLIVRDGMVLANNENKHLYNMDPETGNIRWKEETAGTSSSIRYLNGIVYLNGGSTGRIHAIDTNTGSTVWRLDPARYKDGSDDFKPDLYVIPGENGEKGKVIIQTHNTAYCVEAYR